MSWQQLLSIYKEAQHTYRNEITQRPTACPNDGEPLQPKGSILHCAFDGYIWPESAKSRKGRK